MLAHEELSQLDDIYCAISSLSRRLDLRTEHLELCTVPRVGFSMYDGYVLRQVRNIEDNKKAIERLKQTAKKELTRLLEELK